jgi:hypothetical protein
VRQALALLLLVLMPTFAVGQERAVEPAAPAAEQGAAALLDTDRAFALEILSLGPKAAYGGQLAADGILYDAVGAAPPGQAGAEATFARFPPDARLRRSPEGARVSGDGNSGTSWGSYELGDGEAVVATGRYLTSWRKDESGVWRILAELAAGRSAPRSAAAAAPASPARASSNWSSVTLPPAATGAPPAP